MLLWEMRPKAGALNSRHTTFTPRVYIHSIERVRGEPAWETKSKWQDWLRDQCLEQKGIQVGERVINSCHQSFAQTLLMHSAIVMQNPGQLCLWVDGVRPDLLSLVPALLA